MYCTASSDLMQVLMPLSCHLVKYYLRFSQDIQLGLWTMHAPYMGMIGWILWPGPSEFAQCLHASKPPEVSWQIEEWIFWSISSRSGPPVEVTCCEPKEKSFCKDGTAAPVLSGAWKVKLVHVFCHTWAQIMLVLGVPLLMVKLSTSWT